MPDPALPFDPLRARELPKPERRKPLTRVQFAQLMLAQEGRCGCGCNERLVADEIVDEHIVPLDCLGSNELSNRALYRKQCAQKKTDEQDKPRAAKGRAIRGETGNGPKRKLASRGFDRTKTRGFDGKVRERT